MNAAMHAYQCYAEILFAALDFIVCKLGFSGEDVLVLMQT